MSPDDHVTCPRCTRDLDAHDLCDDDDLTGPLCDRCCRIEHVAGLRAKA